MVISYFTAFQTLYRAGVRDGDSPDVGVGVELFLRYLVYTLRAYLTAIRHTAPKPLHPDVFRDILLHDVFKTRATLQLFAIGETNTSG